MNTFHKIFAFILMLSVSSLHGGEPAGAEELKIACFNHFTSFFRDFKRPANLSFSIRKMPGGEILKALENGTLDLALTDLPPQDRARFEVIPIAVAGQLIAVHRENAMNDISLHDAHELLAGTIADWKELHGARGPLRLYRVASNLPRAVMSCGACKGHDGEEDSKKKEPPKKQPVIFQTANPSKSLILLFVDPDGAAEFPLTSYNEDRVKLLSVNGVAPTLANLDSGKYPLSSKIYLVCARGLSSQERKLVDYIRSREFARLIYADGCLPLKQETESRK